jgi:hypothetical protein
MATSIPIYLESVEKRTFAIALDWPGWARADRTPDAAVAALLAYGPRYARALAQGAIAFTPPDGVADFVIAHRLPGGSSTAFGGIETVPPEDEAAPDPAELARWLAILAACRATFIAVAEDAGGRSLRTGPRGGGRDRDRMVGHVLESERAYLGKLGGRFRPDPAAEPFAQLHALFQEQDATLAAKARGEIAPVGPRGGSRWSARTFIRRSAWHLLDHAWEIEDRLED